MRLLAIIAVIIITFTQPLAAQEANKNMAILTAFLEVINKFKMAGDVIGENCPEAPPINLEGLNKAAEAAKYIKYCKRQLKQKGANTKGTKAMLLLLEKIVAFQLGPDRLTEEDLLLLNQAFGLYPDRETRSPMTYDPNKQ